MNNTQTSQKNHRLVGFRLGEITGDDNTAESALDLEHVRSAGRARRGEITPAIGESGKASWEKQHLS